MAPRPVGIPTLAIPASAAMVLAAWLEGPWLWTVVTLVALATVAGTVACLADIEPRGVPIETTLLPAVGAVTGMGLAHLAGVTPWAIVAVAVGAAALAGSIATERALLRSAAARAGADGGTPARSTTEWRVLAMAVAVAFVGFVGAIGLTDRDFAARLPAAADPSVAGSAQLLVVIIAGALVGAASGYRIAAGDAPLLREAIWAAVTYGSLAGSAVVILAFAGLPVVAWPGLLAALVYLWTAFHRLLGRAGRTPRRLAELLIVASVVAVTAAWYLRSLA